MHRTHRRFLTGLTALALLAASACGDDDDGGGGDGGSGGSGGDPIRIMTITTLENPALSAPQVRAGAKARVDAINADGGINGSPVEFEFCDAQFDPNVEAGCARQAVEGRFDAVVGSDALFPNTLPILERAKVPFIGGRGLTPAELSSDISFPLAGGIPGWYYGAAALLLERGSTRPAIVTTNQSSAEFAGRLAETALGTAGVTPARKITAPIGQPDQAAAASQAADGTDGVALASNVAEATKVVQSMRQAGYTAPIASASTTFTPKDVQALGGAAEGLLLVSQVIPATETGNPAVAQFIREMDASDSGAAKDERSLIAWAAVDLFAKVVERIDDDVTAASVLDAMTNLREPVDLGVTGSYAVAGRTSPVAEYPRLFNPTVVFTEVRDGRTVAATGEVVNPFDALQK